MGESLCPSISTPTSGGISRVGDNGSAGLKLGLRRGEDEELFVIDGVLSSLVPEIQAWERC
jgi:hypothetical protein